MNFCNLLIYFFLASHILLCICICSCRILCRHVHIDSSSRRSSFQRQNVFWMGVFLAHYFETKCTWKLWLYDMWLNKWFVILNNRNLNFICYNVHFLSKIVFFSVWNLYKFTGVIGEEWLFSVKFHFLRWIPFSMTKSLFYFSQWCLPWLQKTQDPAYGGDVQCEVLFLCDL